MVWVIFCIIIAAICFLVVLSSHYDDKSVPIIVVAFLFLIFWICCFKLSESAKQEYYHKEKVIENVHSVSVDTTYVINSEKTDTLYTIHYFRNYE